MTKSLWTPGRLNILLSHIDSHKGENSVYLTDKCEAFSIVSGLISEEYPPSVSSIQVSRKLNSLWAEDRKDEYEHQRDLFRLGRTTLHSIYTEANLIKREGEGQSSVRNRGRRSETLPKKNSKVKNIVTSFVLHQLTRIRKTIVFKDKIRACRARQTSNQKLEVTLKNLACKRCERGKQSLYSILVCVAHIPSVKPLQIREFQRLRLPHLPLFKHPQHLSLHTLPNQSVLFQTLKP